MWFYKGPQVDNAFLLTIYFLLGGRPGNCFYVIHSLPYLPNHPSQTMLKYSLKYVLIHTLLIAHPHLLVRASSERFLPARDTFRVELANESHWLQPVLVLSVRVVYCVVTEANLGIMSCRHDTSPSRHYAGYCLYPDGLEFYRIMCVITLPHFGHVGCKMSTCDDMSTK
jgi:hypothetical protein